MHVAQQVETGEFWRGQFKVARIRLLIGDRFRKSAYVLAIEKREDRTASAGFGVSAYLLRSEIASRLRKGKFVSRMSRCFDYKHERRVRRGEI